MREMNSPMTAEEFEDAVEAAKEGVIHSCNGATDAIQRALDNIMDSDPNDRDEAVREAYGVYQEYLADLRAEEGNG